MAAERYGFEEDPGASGRSACMKRSSREFLKLDVVLSRTWRHRDLGFVSTACFHLKENCPGCWTAVGHVPEFIHGAE